MADLTATPSLYAASPTLLLDGQSNPQMTQRVLSVMVEEHTAGLYRCELTLGNWDAQAGFVALSRDPLDFGTPLVVRIGAGDAAAEIFTGHITGIEAQYPVNSTPYIAILAEDRFQDLRMTRRTRTFEDVGDADVFEQIARAHGLQPEIDVDGPTYRVLTQVNQSDLAFLRERAHAAGAELWLEDDTLHAQKRSGRQSDPIELAYNQGLREFSVLADLSHQRTSLTVSGWDVGAKEGISSSADSAILGSEISGQQSGSQILQDAFGERVERIVHTLPPSRDEAQALADVYYRRIARRFVTGQGVAEGDGRIRVGSRLELSGLGGMFSGTYYVTEVRHMFDQVDGYRTFFSVERPGISA